MPAFPFALVRARVLVLVVLVAGLLACVTATTAGAAGTWGTETILGSPFTEASAPALAVAPDGAAIATMQQDNGIDADVGWVARASGGAFDFHTESYFGVGSYRTYEADSLHSAVAINASGAAVVAWAQRAPAESNLRIQVAYRPAGGAFGTVQTLTADGHDAGVPTVAIDAAGAAVVAWRRNDGHRWQVQAATRGVVASTFTPLAQDVSAEVADAFDDIGTPQLRLAMAPSGDVIVAWAATFGGVTDVERWARLTAGASAFGTVHSLADGTRSADVAFDPSGQPVLAWNDEHSTYLARWLVSGFDLPTTVSTIGGSQLDVRLAVDGSGRAIVALQAQLGTVVGAPVRAGVSTCLAGAACSTVDWISADDGEAENLQLAANAQGDAVLAWHRAPTTGSTTSRIEASLRTHGASFDTPVTISKTDYSSFTPVVGIDAGGNATAAWDYARGGAISGVEQVTGSVDGATTPAPGTGGGGGTTGGGTVTPPVTTRPVTPAPTPAPAPAGPVDATPKLVSVVVSLAKSLVATKAGTFTGPKVACTEVAGLSCAATVTFTVPAPVTKHRGAAKAARPVVVGSAKLTVAGGKQAAPTIKLTKVGKARLAAAGKLALTGTVVVTDRSGNHRTSTVKATLKPAPRRGH